MQPNVKRTANCWNLQVWNSSVILKSQMAPITNQKRGNSTPKAHNMNRCVTKGFYYDNKHLNVYELYQSNFSTT